MVEEIQENLQEYYKNIQIEVKWTDVRKYQIKLLKKVSNHDIIKKSVTFEYKWEKQWTYSANIEQIKFTIDKYFKLYLESEENKNENY